MPENNPSKTVAATRPVEPGTLDAVRRFLGNWYATHRRDLPWRRSTDPYRIWVSEVMLQQTQVKTVVPYYHRFLQRFPDVHALARARLQTVLKLWEGLGYYSRARNMHRCAGIVSGQMRGRFPESRSDWLALPGVGPYIASAVASIAFGQRHAVVDGNVKRVLARLFCLDLPVNQTATHNVFQDLASRLLDRRNPGDHNQAVMELGALVCTPRQPRCGLCPVADECCALRADQVAVFPRRATRARLPQRWWAVGAVEKNGNILLVQRPNNGLLGGLWELPGGPLEQGNDPAEACVRGIKETVNLTVSVETRLVGVRHAYTHFKLHMDVFRCRWRSGRVYLRGPQAYRWIPWSKIHQFPLHRAVHKALTALRQDPSLSAVL